MEGLYKNFVRLIAIAEGYESLAPSRHSLPEPRLKVALMHLEHAIADAHSRMATIRATGDIAGLEVWVDRCGFELEREASQLPGFTIRFGKWPADIPKEDQSVVFGPVEVESFLQTFVDTGRVAIDRIAGVGTTKFDHLPSTRSVDPDIEQVTFSDGVSRGNVVVPAKSVTRGNTRRAGEPEKLHFLFRGSSARGRAIVAGSEADLVFRYDIPPADALASVNSALLDEARRADVDISVEVAPGPGLSVIGARSGVAEFSDGKMKGEVTFRIAAGDAPRTSKLYVDFAVAGEYVHQMEIHVQVVNDMAALQAAPQAGPAGLEIAHAVGAAAGVPARLPSRRIRLNLSLLPGQFRINLVDYRGEHREHEEDFISTSIDRTRLEILFESVRGVLQGCYESSIWTTFDGSQSGPHPPEVAAALARTVRKIASAGWQLNHSLRSDPRIADALDYIDTKAERGTTITVSTEDLFLPWEILYSRFHSEHMTDEEFAEYPLDPELFWGSRFAIETVQRGGIVVGELRRRHISSQPKVSVNLNPAIKIPSVPAPQQPEAVHREWANRLQALGRLDAVHRDCKGIRNALQNASDGATVYYVYCHGSSPSAFGGATEELQLADDCPLKPHELAGGRKSYSGAPIVILNSCKSGAISALTFTSFLTEFRKRGALGLVAATYSVPITFAGRFGENLVEICLRERGSLASDLLELRRQHLIDRGNPVPLFYSLLCQLNHDAADA